MVGERAKNNSGDDPEIFPPDPAQLKKKKLDPDLDPIFEFFLLIWLA